MKRFDEILQQMADYSKNSGIEVDIDSSIETVCISDKEGGEMFMQGEDAGMFISEVERLENEYQEEDYNTILMLAAYPYADLLAE